MGEVLQLFPDEEPEGDSGEPDGFMSGPAVCLACGHRWHAVAPSGECELECPECGTKRGVFDAPLVPENDEVWTCECGCIHFIVTRRGHMCAKCGLMQVFGD